MDKSETNTEKYQRLTKKIDHYEMDCDNLLNYSRNRLKNLNSNFCSEVKKGSKIELEKNFQTGDFYIMSKFKIKGLDNELTFSTVKFHF